MWKDKTKQKEKLKEWRKKHYTLHPEARETIRFNNFRTRLGVKLTRLEYDTLIKKQKDRCAICGEKETAIRNGKVRQLSLDHCHKTSKVRGLLCSSCNIALGGFHDDPELLRQAINYLQTNKLTKQIYGTRKS